MTIEISLAIVISVISLSFSIYMGLKGNKRTDTKDIEERTKERTELNCKLDTINKSTQEIKEQTSLLVEKLQLYGERLIKVEESLKSAWHEIKEIKEEMDKEGKE